MFLKNKFLYISAVLILIGFFIYNSNVSSILPASSTEKLLPIYSVETNNNDISITFDVAWESEDMFSILDTLDKYNVKATFFFCGYWIEKNPDLLIEIYNRGHELGSHGNNHLHGNKLSKNEHKEEITLVAEKIKELLGINIYLFRAPYGEYNNNMLTVAKNENFSVIQWTVDSHDWKGKGVDYEVNQVLNHKDLGNGSILLFHTGTKTTAQSLPIILESLSTK
ncbi:MAG: polysaccharide deacetylase family protein, partial [Lachnospirales bacterium]